MKELSQGILYLCATPIGNLEDITLRALRILKEVDYIAAEDTRHTLKLLNHFEISKPLISYHQHNTREKGPEIINMIEQGFKVALVSDAGMPGISDPGEDLVRLAHEANIAVSIIPGATASLSALVLSGLPTDKFVFEGFLPRENKKRLDRLRDLEKESRTMILYEAPHKLIGTLEDLSKILGAARKISIVRELTKIHEEVLLMTLEEALNYYEDRTPKGEFVLVLEGNSNTEGELDFSHISIEQHLLEYIESGMSKKEAIKQVAKDRNLPKNEVYPYSIGLE